MQETRLIMGMPITVEILDAAVSQKNLNEVFDYFKYVDEKFSTYKKDSEISKLNRNKNFVYSQDMQEVMKLCEQTKKETNGYFNIEHKGKLDPSGLVKGWAILKAAGLIKRNGFKDFYIEAGGDIEVGGRTWTVGIRNPFNIKENDKVVNLKNQGIATSGTYFRGQHVYNPFRSGEKIEDIVSLSVIGPDVYEADRFATAAFAMGKIGITFIEKLSGFEGYMIDSKGIATLTSGFDNYVQKNS
jgi:thiamine biosynthesis lipoprotein